MAKVCIAGDAQGPLLVSDVELSFWGGIDPATGQILDRHHPLCGETLTGHILAVPGGRGSCSGSGVLLELLLNGKGPRALILQRPDEILLFGVILAEEMFGRSIPVFVVDATVFQQLHDADSARIEGAGLWLNEAECARAEHVASVGEVTLSDGDRHMLAGHDGPAAQAAMRIILRMAEAQGAASLQDVTQVHIDGCQYTGPASLAFAERLRDMGGRVKVPTTLNAVSVDLRRWRAQGVEPTFGHVAEALARAYLDMGARESFTCAPYLLETAPAFGEQIAWGESNAVAYANSVLGARTAKYPDYLDACVALTGRAPFSSGHTDAGRKPSVHVRVSLPQDHDDSLFPLLGYVIGAEVRDAVPLVTGLEGANPTQDDLKSFAAAFATTSSAAMFHIAGVTPEAHQHALPDQKVDIGLDKIARAWASLNSGTPDQVDLVSLGNPHFSITELRSLAQHIQGKHTSEPVKLVVTIGRDILQAADAEGLRGVLEAAGVAFVTDTCWCMIQEPVIPKSTKVIATNSAKYAHYGPGLTGRPFCFRSLEDCVRLALGAKVASGPAWLGDREQAGLAVT